MPLGHSWNTFLNITTKSVTDIQFLEYEFYMILTKVLFYKEIYIPLPMTPSQETTSYSKPIPSDQPLNPSLT